MMYDAERIPSKKARRPTLEDILEIPQPQIMPYDEVPTEPQEEIKYKGPINQGALNEYGGDDEDEDGEAPSRKKPPKPGMQ